MSVPTRYSVNNGRRTDRKEVEGNAFMNYLVAGVNNARKNMNAKEYDMADKWAAHKSNGRLARSVGNEPVTYAPDNINAVHDKFLVREAHDQTQVEIPVIDYLTETNLVKQN
ncbi:unnamed protein product [Oikopleura dioica]|uniref:Uncharacterized protein n=1 Tax=Oikopleura dioica TaxID=34765 RepID=E4XKA2_OIKDI|nr:unnamed protein product [Oikopleura dioica]